LFPFFSFRYLPFLQNLHHNDNAPLR